MIAGYKGSTENKILSSPMNVKELMRLQQRFSAVSNVFMYCYNGYGNQLTDITGPREQAERIKECIGAEAFLTAFKRVQENSLEDMIIENTQYDNMKIGAIAIRNNNKLSLCWILIAAIADYQTEGTGIGCMEGISFTTTYNSFLKSMDLLQFMSSQVLSSRNMVVATEAENMKLKIAEDRLKNSFQRTEMTTKIVQFLERTDSIEQIMADMIRLLGEYLSVQSAHIFRTSEIDTMDVICEWYEPGVVPYYEKTRNLPKMSLLRGDKLIALSSDSNMMKKDQECLERCQAYAAVCVPIVVQKEVDLYAVFLSRDEMKAWNADDVKLISDAIKILQNIMIRRIQKNSLTISYASLDNILDHVGAAVFVENITNQQLLFTNKIAGMVFRKEIQTGRVHHLLSRGNEQNKQQESDRYEVYMRDRNQWFDVTKTQLNWVDGSRVQLFAAIDITEKKEYEKQIETQANTDFLTGLYNRMCCEKDLAMLIDSAILPERENGAVIYIDMDNFKEVNDGLGHQYGDILLKSISHAFKSVKGLENHCYRMGGDEFVFLVTKEASVYLDRILKDLQEIFTCPWDLKEHQYYCTMSIGVSYISKNCKDVKEEIKKADMAMYKAKKSGKNQIAFYEIGDEKYANCI